MFGTDPADRDQSAAGTRRLTGLGLIPDPQGWVPEQPQRPLPRAEQEPSPAQPPPEPSRAAPPAAPARVGEAFQAALAERVPPWATGLVERATIAGVAWALLALVVIVVVAVTYLHRHSSGSTGGYSASTYSSPASGNSAPGGSGTGPAASASATDPTSIVVDVSGRVRKPGLVTLPAGARVADAITAAGGPLRARELARVDLAARVTDGQLLLVGMNDAAASGAAVPTGIDPSGSAAPISLSTATIEQLEGLPGVGPVTAQKIIDWRTAHSGFASVEQLQQVPGIGPAHFAEISPLVTP